MKSIRFSTIAKTFAIVAVIALGLGITPTATAQNRGCSEATLKGIFAYTSTGYIVTAPFPPIVGPSAEVGTQSFDGRGGVTFTSNSSQNGNVGPGTATGTYTVNPDCTGTFTQVTPMFTSHFFFVIDQSWAELQAICQDPGAVITRTARKFYPGFAI